MSTQYHQSTQDYPPQAPNASSTHTYRLFKFLKSDAAEQRKAAHYTGGKASVNSFRELF